MAWKPSEKAVVQISTGLPRPLPLCILKEQEVTTKVVYRLPQAIYYFRYIARCQTLRLLLVGDHE